MGESDPFERLLRDLTPDPVERGLAQIEVDTALAEARRQTHRTFHDPRLFCKCQGLTERLIDLTVIEIWRWPSASGAVPGKSSRKSFQ